MFKHVSENGMRILTWMSWSVVIGRKSVSVEVGGGLNLRRGGQKYKMILTCCWSGRG